MSSDGITHVVAGHDVAVHVLLTLCTVKAAEVNLAYELSTSRAFLAGIVLIDPDNNVAKRSDLKKKGKKRVKKKLIKYLFKRQTATSWLKFTLTF